MRKSRFKCMALAMAMGVVSVFSVVPKEVSAASDKLPLNKSFEFKEESKTYSLTLAKSGHFSIERINKSGDADLYVTVYNNDGNKIYDLTDRWSWLTDFEPKYLRAGTYSVVVEGDCLDKGESQEAIIYWTNDNESYPETETKNNDVKATASVIKTLDGKKKKGMLSVGDDYDYYKFTLSEKSKVEFTLDSKQLDPVFTLKTKNGYFIADMDKAEFEDGVYTTVLNEGTYYLMIGRKDDSKHGIYYFSMKSAMVPHWEKVKGQYRYFYKSGKYYNNGFKKINGKSYYFNKSGYRVTGLKKVGSQKYYFNKNGVMQKGWKKINGKWYYFKTSGAMVTGKKKIGNKVYRFNRNGACLNR